MRPILFSGPMVRAILDGAKTQTRRVVRFPKFASPEHAKAMTWAEERPELREFIRQFEGQRLVCNETNDVGTVAVHCPYGQPGDRLWVRETWTADFSWPDDDGESELWWHEMPAAFRGPASAYYVYYLDGTAWACCSDGVVRETSWIPTVDDMEGCRWQPSIHMPRWASRILLELTAVRVERLQDISRADAKAEGFLPGLNGFERWAGQCYGNAQLAYRACWDSLNAKRGLSWDANPWVWVLEFQRVVE